MAPSGFLANALLLSLGMCVMASDGDIITVTQESLKTETECSCTESMKSSLHSTGSLPSWTSMAVPNPAGSTTTSEVPAPTLHSETLVVMLTDELRKSTILTETVQETVPITVETTKEISITDSRPPTTMLVWDTVSIYRTDSVVVTANHNMASPTTEIVLFISTTTREVPSSDLASTQASVPPDTNTIEATPTATEPLYDTSTVQTTSGELVPTRSWWYISLFDCERTPRSVALPDPNRKPYIHNVLAVTHGLHLGLPAPSPMPARQADRTGTVQLRDGPACRHLLLLTRRVHS